MIKHLKNRFLRFSTWLGLGIISAVIMVACGGGGGGGTTPNPDPDPNPVEAQRAVENVVTPTNWTFCSDLYFGGCEFKGLREVRLGARGQWITKRYLNSFPGSDCNPDVFGGDPSPPGPGEAAETCEVSNVEITGTIAAPNVCYAGGMCPQIDLTAIPMGNPGYSELRLKATTDFGDPDPGGVGAFRTICGYSHMAFDDPIVFPGQPGMSHLHAFFGNTGVNAYSTAQSLSTTGNSTCAGGIANRSAYWVPAMIDTATHKPIVPSDPIWYYKSGYNGIAPADINAMPAGLRMIAGNMRAEGPQDMAHWSCRNGTISHSDSIPNCDVGDYVTMHIDFPQCWDGVNLDSSDHKSHMADPVAGACPSSHPVAIPVITLNVLYLVRTANEAQNWRLSSDNTALPPGYSIHADWFDGWNSDVRNTWIENCVRPSKDCNAYLIGDGRIMY